MNDLEKTDWAKRFKKECPSQYQNALDLIKESNKVRIYYNNEIGKYLYSIVSFILDDFWFDSFKNKEDAIKLCEEMGWEMIE